MIKYTLQVNDLIEGKLINTPDSAFLVVSDYAEETYRVIVKDTGEDLVTLNRQEMGDLSRMIQEALRWPPVMRGRG